MSPEQCRGDKNMTFKSDLYSLGVVLYEFLTGKRPFQAQAPMEMFLQHIKGTFERPSRLALDVPVWLDTLVCQLLEKKPEHRPRDAAAVAEALERISEKMTAQPSAGVELVGARAADRPAGPRLAAEDRETARALHAAVTGRKHKRKRTPVYQRGWFIGLGIVALLAVLAWLVYVVTRPPSPEALFAEAEKLMASDSADDWDRAIDERTGPIPEYFRRYGRIDDDRSARMREWSERAHAALKERQFANRLRLGMPAQDEIEESARNGLRYEESGNIPAARKTWEAVRKQAEEAEGDGAWATIADKRFRDLHSVEERYERWQRQVSSARREGKRYAASDERGQLALRAIHFEQFGDEQGARDVWAQLRLAASENRTEERFWTLLAAWTTFRAHNANSAGKEERIDYARTRLTTAEILEDSDPLQARILYRDIVTLYRDAPEFADVVDRARTRLPSDER
jgi:serine/threonine-protein kinase